jgi:chorismate mutase
MDIAEWRKQIDELDRQIIELLNRRAKAAHEIGKLKRSTDIPIYEPDREKSVLENVRRENPGPLSNLDVTQIYERIMDIMRNIQVLEIAPEAKKQSSAEGGTEFDLEVND